MNPIFKNLLLMLLLGVTISNSLGFELIFENENIQFAESIEFEGEEKNEQEEKEDKLCNNHNFGKILSIDQLLSSLSKFELSERHLPEIPTPPPKV